MSSSNNKPGPKAGPNKTDRLMSTVALVILSLGGCYAIYSLGPPVYWRFYATVVRPFEDHGIGALNDDPFASVLDSRSMPGSHQAGARSDLEQTAKAVSGAVVAAVPAAVVVPAVAAVVPAVVAPKAAFRPEDYPLNKLRAQQHSEQGYVMVTWANNHYLDFAVSWVANIKKIGLKGYMVGAMDDEVLEAMVAADMNTWRMNTGITKNDLGWGSPNFHKMGRWKIQLIKQFLELDVMVIISDIDTAWMRNPLPFFERYPTADILTSSDELRPTVKDESLENFPQAGSSFNIGIMLFRLTSKAFVDAWIKQLEDPQMWDQNAFNNVARIKHTQSDARGLWRGFNNTLTLGVLPVSIFASGHVFFVQRKHEELGLGAYVAHATFQYSGTPGKRHRFRESLLWSDPPSYFDHAVGFMRYDPDIPADMLAKANGVRGDMTEEKLLPHFDLVNHQLLRLRNAIAIAQITGRVLVMPPIMCGLDKYWGPLLNGGIPGSMFKKPFICPMDHILDLEGGWSRKRPELGPHVEWREYSFFQNERLTAAVNNSRIKIEVCAAGVADCHHGESPVVKDNRLRLSSGLDSAQLSIALKGLTQYKVLDFSSMALLFTKFTDEAAQNMYIERLKNSVSVFCCVNKQPGWIWYDFLWDQPHRDRFNREFQKWHYKRGDQATAHHHRRMLGAQGAAEEDGRAAVMGGQTWGLGDPFLQRLGQEAMVSVP